VIWGEGVRGFFFCFVKCFFPACCTCVTFNDHLLVSLFDGWGFFSFAGFFFYSLVGGFMCILAVTTYFSSSASASASFYHLNLFLSAFWMDGWNGLGRLRAGENFGFE
jgi:hypothetical protein